jgi:hypothetical protein
VHSGRKGATIGRQRRAARRVPASSRSTDDRRRQGLSAQVAIVGCRIDMPFGIADDERNGVVRCRRSGATDIASVIQGCRTERRFRALATASTYRR